MKRLLAALIVLVIVAGVLAGFAYQKLNAFLNSPLTVPENGELVEVTPGAPFAAVSTELEARGIVSHGTVLRWYASWSGDAEKVHAGEYLVAEGTTPLEFLEQLTSGAVQLYSFTLVEGWNHREMLAALQAHPEVDATMDEASWPELLDELGAQAMSPEGLFLPETYRFPKGTRDRDVLAQAFNLMQSVLDQEWETRAADIPLASPYEALILASIVEKETARVDERQRIAGVFTRRLEKKMRLQTDPTVIYGIGPSFDGNLTRRHLRTDTPYNTYTRAGLPPTPIAMPGRDAIHAAVQPADGEALYFVATGLGDGSHKFSVTREEHEAAVQEYLQRLRQSR